VGGSTCYEELNWVETFMNNATVKAQLGVDPARNFTGGGALVYLDFRVTGDGMRNSAPLLTNLVNNGIRLLVYAGNAGMSTVIDANIIAFLKLNDLHR
jgi:cathepsin A (carboxypeptidase C)